jgi:hypothetical protein
MENSFAGELSPAKTQRLNELIAPEKGGCSGNWGVVSLAANNLTIKQRLPG